MTTTRLQIPIPINEAEAIVEPFWDATLTHLDEWRVTGAPGSNARASQFWCWCALAWDHAPVDRPVLSFARTMNVDISDHDRLIVRMALPKHIHLQVAARVDGQERVVIDEPGRAVSHEYEGEIHGRVLQELTLTLRTPIDQPENVWLPWIALAHEGRRRHMLGRPSPYDPEWPGWLLPAEERPALAPRFGFFFAAEDLPAIRRRAHSPAYRPLMERLRSMAREALSCPQSPEELIGPYLHGGWLWEIQERERGWSARPFANDAPVCALVGLIDEDPELLRFAARIVLSMCHTPNWVAPFMQGFPGSTWDVRGSEALLLASMIPALDWAGGYLTGKAEHLARYTITHQALGRIRGTFLQYDYMWDCNQHHLLIHGRLLGQLVQQRAWPRAAADIDQTERDLYEIVERYVQEDGSTNEGALYWSHSFHGSMIALAALARYRGKALADVVPPRLHRMWEHIAALLSTAAPGGAFLTTSDSLATWLNWDTISLLAAAGVQGGWRGVLGDRLRSGGDHWNFNNDVVYDGLFTLIYGPDEPSTDPVVLPTFRKLKTAGTVTSNRPWQGSGVHLYLLGQMANAGHSHADKGSFILEAAGDLFAGDRGCTPYRDSQGWLALRSELAHNLAQPEGVTQINPSPAAALWQAEGDEQMLRGEIDTSAVWNAPVRRAVRRIESPSPERIEITDEFDLDEERPIHWYLNTPLPVSVTGHTAVVQGKAARLTVTAEWADKVEAGEYYFDWSYRPYNRLVATSRAAKRHVLKTVLVLDVHPT